MQTSLLLGSLFARPLSRIVSLTLPGREDKALHGGLLRSSLSEELPAGPPYMHILCTYYIVNNMYIINTI